MAAAEQKYANVASLPAKSKLERLLRVAKGKHAALILTHDNPDPDSLAAAMALKEILEQRGHLPTRVAYGGIIGRAENLAFVKVLRLPVVPVSQVVFDEFDLIALVDTQQSIGNHSLPPNQKADVVIDHHPLRDDQVHPPLSDVGRDYGATSTLLVEYLRRRESSRRASWRPRSITASRPTPETSIGRPTTPTSTATSGCSRE